MAQITKLGLSATSRANYNTSLFANKNQAVKILVPHLDFMPLQYGYMTRIGVALMRKPTNRGYN